MMDAVNPVQSRKSCLKIASAFLMPAITIELDRVARTFTRSTAILTTWLWWTGTTRILALIFVRHGILLTDLSCLYGVA